jgi:membrane-associated phospholipid phosphatase
MNKLLLRLLASFFAIALIVQAKDTTKALPYFDPATVDVKTLLGDPPADGSAETKKEIEIVLQAQAARTGAEVKRIKREVHLDVWLFDTVFGPWFTAKDLPATTLLFTRIEATEHPIIDSAKKYWSRPRPFLQDSRIHPPIELPKNASYPSGHSTVGNLYGMVLAELAPDLKENLLARGKQIGDDRVIGGVHFPSDVAAGHKLAEECFKRLMASPEFQADLNAAKAEIAAARAKK